MNNESSKFKTVIVTGAGGGMGRTACSYFASLGWHVLAIDRNQTRLELIKQENIETLCIDLVDESLLEQVKIKLDKLPTVWGLVNLAGISQGDSIDKPSLSDWQASFDTNVTAALKLIQFVVPIMKKKW